MTEGKTCSICQKCPAKYFCIGCKRSLCSKDLKQHEQQLSIRFDREVVDLHGEILADVQKIENDNSLWSKLFQQIEQWKKTTIEKIEQIAEQTRNSLTEYICEQKLRIKKHLELITNEINRRRNEENFLEHDISRLSVEINGLKNRIQQLFQEDKQQPIVVIDNQIDWNRLISIRDAQQNLPPPRTSKWSDNGITVAGGNGRGNLWNQLLNPSSLCIDDDDNQTLYIADHDSNRVVQWRRGATVGRVVAGGNGHGNLSGQLYHPTDAIIDKKKNSLLICDFGNERIVQWPLRNGACGETILSNVTCWSLSMDDNGFLYVVDHKKHEVRKYQIGEQEGTVVAGGNGKGNGLDQLNGPLYIYVDHESSVYISDTSNHRVVKWTEGAKQGIIVAGGQGQGNSLMQLSYPLGLAVDEKGSVYVVDSLNHRVMCWQSGAVHGEVIIGENQQGKASNQLSNPIRLAFDQQNNIYVSDNGNYRVQKFNFDDN